MRAKVKDVTIHTTVTIKSIPIWFIPEMTQFIDKEYDFKTYDNGLTYMFDTTDYNSGRIPDVKLRRAVFAKEWLTIISSKDSSGVPIKFKLNIKKKNRFVKILED